MATNAIPSIQKVAPTKKEIAAKAAKKKEAAKAKNPNGLPLLNAPKDIAYDPVTGEQINVGPLNPTDTTIRYDQVTGRPIQGGGDVFAGTISARDVTAGTVNADTLANQFMTAADYSIVDPSKIASEYGDINRSEIAKNAALSSKLALDTLDTELKGLTSFAPAAAALQRGEIARDNAFNQAQKDAQLAATDPNIRSDLEAQRGRASAFASGRLPSSIDDRALELGIRSSAADAASAGGFGVSSGAARKASALLSAQNRIGLSQYGDELLTSNIANRSNLLFAPLEAANAGSQISAVPTQSAGQIALGIAADANAGNITADKALTNLTQQAQFKTGLEQETRTTNVNLAATRDLNQAKLNLDASSTNVSNALNADLANQSADIQVGSANQDAALRAGIANQGNRTQLGIAQASNDLTAQEINARNAITAQSTQIATKSQESQFDKNLELNVKTGNADRAFTAANANAGRALQVASDNRAVRLDVQKTNKNMIFQDQQARKAEAAASARAAAAEAGANARAAMSAAASQAAIAANLEAQKSAQAFSLEQQRIAGEQQQAGLEAGQHAANVATTGNLIARAPSVIAGVGTIATLIGGAYDYLFGGGSSDGVGLDALDYS